jgi:hypothetical protein
MKAVVVTAEPVDHHNRFRASRSLEFPPVRHDVINES